MSSLAEMAQTVRREAGWSEAPLEVEDGLQFDLTDALTFRLVKPSDRLAAFKADLGAWPSDENEADELARRAGRLAAASFSSRRSTFFSRGGRCGLHLAFDPDEADVPGLCAEFLNDLEWWRRNLRP
jgi:hypothetical protein